ncbi:HlyD family secretion protein [Bacillus songklensis]|uniref:HlyD family secretion protein n=1 Tax=Bacillus songklensis TaxID=1069116 RepID=A0ABV8B2V1_9BACI
MKRKIVLMILFAVMIASGGSIGYYYWYQGSHYVKTEDARIQGDQYKVMPQIPGEITSIDVGEGDLLQQNEVIAEQDLANIDPSMINKSIIRAPISGNVIKIFSKEHETVAPGQAIALMVNMDELYVSANIEETEIGKVKEGQLVDITIDTLDGQMIQGKVRKIGQASNSAFALVPAVNTSGNFNKVKQRIPIEIAISKPEDMKLVPGTNVEIKIHIS